MPRITVSETMAGMIYHYYGGPMMGAPKHLITIRDVSRYYTGLVDMPGARIQMLNEEIRFAEGQKESENSLLTASKGANSHSTNYGHNCASGFGGPGVRCTGGACAQRHKTIGGDTQPKQE